MGGDTAASTNAISTEFDALPQRQGVVFFGHMMYFRKCTDSV